VNRFLCFCVVGTLGFGVDAAVLQALVSGPAVDPYAARVASFLAAATATWWLNRRYTFKATRRASPGEWVTYTGLMTLGAAVNYGAYAASITWWELAREHLWIGVALGSIAGLGINYATSRSLVFRDPGRG
jgi:putative flippase GtrA